MDSGRFGVLDQVGGCEGRSAASILLLECTLELRLGHVGALLGFDIGMCYYGGKDDLRQVPEVRSEAAKLRTLDLRWCRTRMNSGSQATRSLLIPLEAWRTT